MGANGKINVALLDGRNERVGQMVASMLVQPVMSRTGWEHFPHEADVGVRGFGATPAVAFEQGALALTAVVTHARVEPLVEVEVSCQAARC